MIVVTIGTTPFPFTRLFEAIDKSLCTQKMNKRLVVQSSFSDYRWSYRPIEIYQSLPPETLNTFFKEATYIVTHGGFGTMYTLASMSSVMPLTVARNPDYKEHVDSHQLYFLDHCKEKVPLEYQDYFVTEKNLYESINNYFQSPSQKNICKPYLFNPNKQPIIKTIENYLTKI